MRGFRQTVAGKNIDDVDITTADPKAVATGMKITFAVAGILIVVAFAIASRALRNTPFALARHAGVKRQRLDDRSG
jgi:hypothetical protein